MVSQLLSSQKIYLGKLGILLFTNTFCEKT